MSKLRQLAEAVVLATTIEIVPNHYLPVTEPHPETGEECMVVRKMFGKWYAHPDVIAAIKRALEAGKP